jgi:hypothetical protein
MKTIVKYATSLHKKGRSVVDRNVPDPEPDPYVFGLPGIRSRNFGSFHQLILLFSDFFVTFYL